MSDRNFNDLDEQQRLAKDAVGSLPRPEANADFRALLKERFVAGDLDDGELSETRATTTGADSRLGSVWLGWSALAAAAVVTFALLGFNRLPGPELVGTNGVGSVVINGREVTIDRTGVINGLLHVGTRVQVGEGASLDLIYPGTLAMRLAAGTDMVLPERPGRWFRRTVEANLAAGDLSLRTGPDLAGGGIIVRTDEGQAMVHGTLISIVRNDDVTCICLCEGHAGVEATDGDLAELPAGKRWVLFRDGREPSFMDIEPTHLAHMLAMDGDIGGRLTSP